MPTRLLVVEDDERVAQTLKRYLTREGYDVALAADGGSALRRIQAGDVDLVVLDVMLPEIDGVDVCRRVRARSDVPIVMLTGRTTLDDRLNGLDAGADDYITKPFAPREVVARVRAVLRRAADRPPRRALAFGPLRIDPAARAVTVSDTPVALTQTEFRLLETLARANGAALTRAELIERGLGLDYRGNDRTIDTHVLNLRGKLGCAAAAVVTVFGAGYRFDPERIDG